MKNPTALATAPLLRVPAIMLASLLILLASALAQGVRPTIMNPGEASETPKTLPRVDRSRVGPTKASRPSLSVLVVLTEPKIAEIRIDGKPVGKSQDGRFTKELAPRKYKISVSAGGDYLEYEQGVTVKPREPAIVEAPLTPRFGTIRIFPAREGVNLLDNDQAVPKEKRTVDNEQRIVLERIPPGDHKITYDLPGYVLYQRSFKVTPGSEFSWYFEPERAVTELTVLTEPGATVYFDNKQVGKTPANGTLAYKAELGSHQVKLVKEDFEEYTETREFKYREPVTLDKRLVPLPTSAEFSDDFDVAKPDLWATPQSGVSFKNGRMQLDNAKTLASPSNTRYRNFEMSFLLRLDNAGGAAWAVRAKDANNYYLFYLSGPTGLPPNRFNTYIVRNGEFDPSKPFRSDPLIEQLTSGGQYTIVIKATGNKIEHEITPAATGKATKLGFFDDPNSTFLLGGIGFRSIALERFSVDDLYVRPPR